MNGIKYMKFDFKKIFLLSYKINCIQFGIKTENI